ncbi:MAG: hypothetical protein ABIK19_03750 [candidate division WOR-3 bacterium]
MNEQNRILSAIGYIPFLCFLPIYLAREDEFAQFHGKQSLVLFALYILISLALWLVSRIFGGILGHVIIIGFMFKVIGWLLYNVLGVILGIIYIILIILGFIYAITGNKWEIPFVSSFAQKVKI